MPSRPPPLDAAGLAAALADLPGWVLREGALSREFTFADFPSAFGFMAAVAVRAEAMGHHPDWSNSWRTVRVRLRTHSAGGVTALDVALAREMQALARPAGDDAEVRRA